MKTVTREMLPHLLTSGLFCGVTFRKKDGSLRNLTGRTGVGNHAKGVGLKFDPADKGMIVMWETDKRNRKSEKDAGYRFVTLGKVTEVRAYHDSFAVVD